MMSRLASAQHVFGSQTCASDGFFLNLGWVMLRLAAPFARGDGHKSRLPSIDPLYCTAARDQAQRAELGGTLLNFSSETQMVPVDSGGNKLYI